jgi:hypothetical protein
VKYKKNALFFSSKYIYILMATKNQNSSFFEQISLFFGGDKKGAQIASAIYGGSDFVNSQYKTTTDLYGSDLWEMMKVGNYHSTAKKSNQSNDDVHQDFTDAIINAANYHNTIDKPTGSAEKYGNIFSHDHNPGDLFKIFLNDKMIIDENENDQSDYLEKLKKSGKQITNGDLLKYILFCSVSGKNFYTNEITNKNFCKKQSPQPAPPPPAPPTPQRAPQQAPQRAPQQAPQPRQLITPDALKNGRSNLREIDSKMKEELTKQTPSGPEDAFQNLKDNLKHIRRGVAGDDENDENDENDQNGGENDEITHLSYDDLTHKFCRDIFFKNFYDDGTLEIVKISFGIFLTGLQMKMKIEANASRISKDSGAEKIFSFLSNESYFDQSKFFNTKFFMDVIKLAIDNVTDNDDHTTLDDQNQRKLYVEIKNMWPVMTLDAREFYKTHLSILAKKDSKGYNFESVDVPMGNWRKLSSDGYEKLMSEDSPNFASFRLNISKDPSGSSNILFSSSLPKISKDSAVWYSKSQTKDDIDKHVVASEDFFQQLYQTVYTGTDGKSDKKDFGELDGQQKFTARGKPASGDQLESLRLDYGKYISGLLKVTKKGPTTQQAAQAASSDVGSIDDYTWLNGTIVQDNAYGNIWRWNSTTKSFDKKVNDNWVPDQSKSIDNRQSCYGTFLGEGNCDRVINCLFSGDQTKLGRCLDLLEDDSMWNIAKDDLESVPPNVIIKVLKTFGFKATKHTDRNGVVYKIPISFQVWKDHIVSHLPDAAQKAINDNNKLQGYLKNLVTICRKNPDILNRQKVNTGSRPNTPAQQSTQITPVQDGTTPQYFRDLGLRQYAPLSKTPSGQANLAHYRAQQVNETANLLSGLVQQQQNLPRQYEAQMGQLFGGYMQNVRFVSPTTSNVSPLMGGAGSQISRTSIFQSGASHPEANNFRTTFQSVIDGLKQIGYKIHPNDQAKFEKALKDLGNLENKLAKAMTLIINMLNLLKRHGLDVVRPTGQENVINLDRLKSEKDLGTFVNNIINELDKGIRTNLVAQDNLSQGLLNSFIIFLRQQGALNDQNIKNIINQNGQQKTTKNAPPEMVDLTD